MAITKNYINDVFTQIAKNYDLMNNVISLGSHNRYKRKAIDRLLVKQGELVLDLATGTGDLAEMIARQFDARMIIADRNITMLQIAQARTGNNEIFGCDAAELPFQSNSFNHVIVGFGIRNFQQLDKAFGEIYRILKPGGKLVALEFAQPGNGIIKKMRNFYFRKIVPLLSRVLIGKYAEYHYLAASVINFHDQQTILHKLSEQQYKETEVHNYIFGSIAIFEGRK